jgi:RNA polymerase sigma factor (sigma-70 family)
VRAGFEELFGEQFEAMKRLAFLLGADDAENVAQEAFVRLHRRWAGLREPVPYLHRTVVNLTNSRLRHLRVVRRTPPERPGTADSPEEHVLAGHAVRAALAQLTERQRQVLVLRYWLGLDQAAIGAALGIAVGTVKATTSQALDRLRTLMTSEEVPG